MHLLMQVHASPPSNHSVMNLWQNFETLLEQNVSKLMVVALEVEAEQESGNGGTVVGADGRWLRVSQSETGTSLACSRSYVEI